MNFDQLETREASSRKLFTGFAPVQIIAVNPTAAELNNILGISDAKEPVYEKDDTMRLDFWYVNHPESKTEMRGKFSLWVNNESRVSQSGKNQYIDNYTKTAWATNLAGLSEMMSGWDANRKLDMKSVREAKRGEETLYGLMKAYVNANPKSQPFVLDSWSDIANGRTSELEGFFNHFNKQGLGVKILLGIKDGQYQDTYTGIFLHYNGRVTDYVKKNVEGEYGFKSHYGSYDLSLYDPENAPATSEVEANISWNDPFNGAPQAQSASKEADPFAF